MTAENDSFTRLLRFYPKRWRRANGEFLLATLREDAHSRGLRAPDAGLRRSALVNGLGTRLDLRAAMILSGVSIPLAHLYQELSTGSLLDLLGLSSMEVQDTGREALLRSMAVLIGDLLVPLLVMTAAVALVAGRSLVTPPRALASATTFLLAALLNAVRAQSYALFGASQSSTRIIEGLLWAQAPIVAIGVGLIADQLLEARIPQAAVRWSLALLIGAPFGLMALVLNDVQLAWIVFAIPVFGVSVILALRNRQGDPRRRTPIPASARMLRIPAPMHTRISVTLLGLLGLLLASVERTFGLLPGLSELLGATEGVFGSFDGWAWIAAFPMLIAWGLCESHRYRGRALGLWGPIALLAASWALVTAMTVNPWSTSPWGRALHSMLEGFEGDPHGFGDIVYPFFLISAPAIVWIVDHALPRTAWIRVLGAFATAAGWALLSVFVVLGAPFFFTPLLCLIVIIRVWTARRRVRAEGDCVHSADSRL